MGLPKLNRKGPDRPAELHKRIAALEAEIKRLREALEIIAGDRTCLDNLMGNVDIARAALAEKGETDDLHHTKKTA